MITNDNVAKRAQDIAARRRDGSSWTKYLDRARAELQEPTTELKKVVKKSTAKDETLRTKATLAAQARHMPGVGSPDPNRRREIGEIETALGRVRVTVAHDSLRVHGVNVLLADIDVGLRGALVTASAAFAAAESDIEQSEQRVVIGYLVDAILRRDKTLEASVRAAKLPEQFDN
jgi:hypothetical protein